MSAAAVSGLRPSQPAVTATGTTTGSDATLLPDAAPLGMSGLDDALSLLYLSMAQEGQHSLQTGESRVQTAEKQQQKALGDEQAAQQREQANEANHGRGLFSSVGHLVGDVAGDLTHGHVIRAAKDAASDVNAAVNSPAFWNDLEQGALVVAKVSAVVGSAVITTASFGAGAGSIVAAAFVLSAGGEVISDTGCLGKQSGLIGGGLEVAGAVTGLAAGFGATGLTAASKVGLGIGAAFTGLGGEAETVAGGAHVVNQGFAANVESASADAQRAIDQNGELQQMIGWVLDDLKASDKSTKRAEQSVQDAIQGSDQATAAASASISVKG